MTTCQGMILNHVLEAMMELDHLSRYDLNHVLETMMELDHLVAALLELLSSSIGCYC